MKKRSCMALLFIVAFSACFGQQRKISGHDNKDSIRPLRLIPYTDSGVNGNRQKPFVKNLGKLLGLPDLTNGKEGCYIRIWFWDDTKKYVVNISHTAEENNCSIMEFRSARIDSAEFIAVYREWKNVQLKSGWDKLFAVIEKDQIQKKESGTIQHRVKDFLTMMSYVQFEIATPGQYLYYDYLEPYFYRYVDPGSKQVDNFLMFLSKEIPVPVYYPVRKAFVKPS